MLIEVRRETLEPCCAGRMYVDGEYFGFTLERPWLDNQPNVSAIPAGEYGVTVDWSPRFRKNMIHILSVPGRFGIRIHGANSWKELNGCIAVSRNKSSVEYIYNSLAVSLRTIVEKSLSRGEAVKIRITNPSTPGAPRPARNEPDPTPNKEK